MRTALGTRDNPTDTSIEIIELRPQELSLIKTIRSSLRFGEVTIIVRDGVPVQMKRITELVNLSPST